MALEPGARLGPYEIQCLLGMGGMGEVYRAKDTRLNRDVAIKVLPELFAHDPETLARFSREAQLLASFTEFAFGSGWTYGAPYDTAADGRFLALVRTEAAPALHVRVVLGWDRELARLGLDVR